MISPNPPKKPAILFAFLPTLLLPGGSDVFSAGSAAPGAGAQPDVTPRCTSSSHLCWQRSKDRSEQRLSARAVLIGGSCSLKRLLNNVKKLCRIFKSLLSEPSYPSSSLAPRRAHVHPHPGDVLALKGAILSPCLPRSAVGVGWGTRLHPCFSPKGGWWQVCGAGKGCTDPPAAALGRLRAATSRKKPLAELVSRETQ